MVNLHKNIYKTTLETLYNATPHYSMIKEWVANFKRGDFNSEDGARSGRPTSVTSDDKINKIHDMIIFDRRISCRTIGEECSLSLERAWNVIHNILEMKKTFSKMGSKMF